MSVPNITLEQRVKRLERKVKVLEELMLDEDGGKSENKELQRKMLQAEQDRLAAIYEEKHDT